MMDIPYCRIIFSWLLLGGAAGLIWAKEPATLPGLRRDGSVLLPNQWSLHPVGGQITVGDFPVNLAVHPSGHYAAVLHCGYSEHEIRIIDLQGQQSVSAVGIHESFYGLTWSPDGTKLYCSGASDEVVHEFLFAKGRLSNHRERRVRPTGEIGVPVGIAASEDGRALYVAEGWGHRIVKLSLTTGKPLWTRTLASAQRSTQTDPAGERMGGADDAAAPFPYTCLPDRKRNWVYVSLWGAAAVLVLDTKTGDEVVRWPVGEHPNEMALSADGRLFVAEANLNSVSIINVVTGQLLEKLSTSLAPDAPPGSMPNSLALTPDGRQLYVANATNNDVAIFDVSAPGKSVSLGFIPVGWFPTSVRVTPNGGQLIVANGKGLSSAANPEGPFPGDARPKNLQAYIGGLFRGSVSVIDLPKAEQRSARFGQWTEQTFKTIPAAPARARDEHNPIPEKIGAYSPIQYVIYVIKENRTYDQMLGDLTEGNGDSRLCLFGEAVTPNHHALAREFVLLDNFYVDGEVSADGHEWTMGAFASDFVEKTWPLNYGHRGPKIDYPSEGAYLIAYPSRGYLWNQASRAGVTFRSYGEFVSYGGKPGAPETPALPVLKGHIDPFYRGFDLDYPDVKRVERFRQELENFEQAGEMPRLQVVRLGSDHTQGTSPGKLTPTAMVADNDLALGRLVDAVSHSKFWPKTAIFVLEDDAQNGPDHVDAHRSPAFIISSYTLRKSVDSSMYSTTSMLRTIELILGLHPMSQYDAAAAPLFSCFSATQDLTPYTARPAQVDLNERNRATAWGARKSKRMDFREADRADDLVLNEIVWRSVKGSNSPMPAPVRAAYLKVNQTGEKDDD